MTLEEAKEFFYNDVYAMQTTGIEILEIATNYSKVSLKLNEKHLNAVGKVMGGVFFTIADFAFAVATNSKENWTVTTNSQINYLSSVKGDTIIAECKQIKEGKTLCTYEITLVDNLGTKVAYVISNGMHLK